MSITSAAEILEAPISTSRLGTVLRRTAAPLVVAVIFVATMIYVGTTQLDSIERRTLNADYIGARIGEHLLLTVAASSLVALLAIPLGILVFRMPSPAFRAAVLGLANIGQATPAVGVVILSRAEALNEVAKRLDPETGVEEIVEGRERSAVEDTVVGQRGIGRHRATPSGFELQPSRRGAVAQRGDQAPWSAGRAVPIANMGELHRRSEDRPVIERV